MEDREYRVGELAKRAGLTVRTLHHWEEVGLLGPTQRTRSGHRLYGPEAVRRLQRIRSLKALGLGLGQIRTALESSASTLEEVLRAHRDQVRNQRRMLKTLEDRLERTLELLRDQGRVPEEELIRTMEMMTMIEKHFTSEQMDRLNARASSLGEETIQNAQTEWPRLISRMTEEMEKGTDPATPEVQKLAGQWQALIHAFTGGDKGTEASLAGMYQAKPEMAAEQGLNKDLFEYLGRALQAGE
jgi:DNA-binding transcriptional MerR regulator